LIPPSSTSPFAIEIKFTHPETETEFKWVSNIPAAEFRVKEARAKGGELLYHGLTNDKICKALSKITYADVLNVGQAPPPIP